mgnify:FL=1
MNKVFTFKVNVNVDLAKVIWALVFALLMLG